MCGFVGFINKDNISNPRATIQQMNNSIIHRGPDDEGYWSDLDQNLFLGFRRLAIVDLTQAGHQPMISSSRRYIICINGEIYNHLELRAELNSLNSNNLWRGSSDSETFLELVEVFGVKEAIKKAIGMFAISIYDRKDKKIFLARDRFGEKPLYYGKVNNSLVFGSELSAFKKFDNFQNNFSSKAINLFLNYSYVPSPLSIYEEIHKVDAGEIVTINLLNPFEPKKDFYWDLTQKIQSSKENVFQNFDEGVNELEVKLRDSLSLQMKADVPLGAFLSGGIDSSLITALMQDMSPSKIKTFTIGFHDAKYDESRYAKPIADFLSTDHMEIKVTDKEALDVIPNLPTYYSEPFADSSQIPTFLVSKIAKQKVTVSLSGDGGDELFGGYNRYLWGSKIWNKIDPIPFKLRKIIGEIGMLTPDSLLVAFEKIATLGLNKNSVSFLNDKVKKLSSRLKYIDSHLSLYNSLATEWNAIDGLMLHPLELSSQPFLDLNELKFLTDRENMMFWDIDSYMKDDILTKVDRASMANSLETRAPFLDHRVAETAFKFTEDMLFKDQIGKMPLRSILDKYVPKELIDRPKSGFGIPIGDWMRAGLKDWAESNLCEDKINQQGILNPLFVTKLWEDHKEMRSDNTVKLWNILMLNSWIDENS
ncbi:asparagine synthase (glutamine-hydrolyzing) [Gammaproteobacteria bacterium]|jgi:asparagine synthase (glutamine-hydrolysing)|nr:asparagine synthase (glutamine-hydrolyzing) [Gammaproteobacteria bacterium]MDC0129006.1 asparagine synthase (glutamine-hydrolyzing) [Gammaproteobacteria bacterium]